MSSETIRVGPCPLYSTWTMERLIGDLGGEIRQPSNPYKNLSERGLRRCQSNALKATYPQLEHETKISPLAEDIGDGYKFLQAREESAHVICGAAGTIIKKYFEDEEIAHGNDIPMDWIGPKVHRWARLQLPIGDIARSGWKEKQAAPQDIRRARYVKVSRTQNLLDSTFIQTHFYF